MSETPKVHESLTAERILAACEDSMFGMDDPGFCISCGEEHQNIEPDAESYECEACGEPTVFGAEQMLIMGMAVDMEV